MKIGIPANLNFIDFEDQLKIKGKIINDLIDIEDKINCVIAIYFKPNNLNEFKEIMLNSSIISFGQKVKIINNITGIEKNVTGKISELSSIRNGIAHVRIENTLELGLESRVVTELKVMNSSGILKTKNFTDLVKKYSELSNQVHSYLDDYLNN